ncbi:MAG: T9SS type A sorting domain-containing protein [Candidatus Eisenbacteria bacterium]
MRLLRVPVLTLVFLVVASESNLCAGWQPDRRITSNPGRSGLSSGNAHCIAADSAGTVHIVWHDDTSGNYEIYHITFDSLSILQAQPRRLTWNSGKSANPSLALLPDSSVFVVWADDSETGFSSIAFARFYPWADTLADSGLVSQGLSDCAGSSCAVDGAGAVHIVWAQITGQAFDIFYRKWDNGWVAAPVNLSSNGGSSVSGSVAADGLGNVHVVWADNMPGNYEVLYRRYSEASGWEAVYQVSSSRVIAWSPCVAADREGYVYAVWSDRKDQNFEVYFRRRIPGAGWGAPKRLTYNGAISANPNAVVDHDGNLHILWEDFRDGNDELYYRRISSIDGPGWDPIDTRLTRDVATSWDGTIAVDCLGNLHVVWSDNRTGNFDIYYKFGIKPVPVSVDILRFEAASRRDGVFLTWDFVSDEGTGPLFNVYRRAGNDGSLIRITDVPLCGVTEFLDSGALPGTTYEYFLGIWQGEGTPDRLFGSVTVLFAPQESPGPTPLAVWPNPSSGTLNVAFSLGVPRAGFRVTLFDVSGRFVAEMASGIGADGVTTTRWDGRSLPIQKLCSGVYIVALEAEGRRTERKVVILR